MLQLIGPTNQFSLNRRTAQVVGIGLSYIYSGGVNTPSVLLPIAFQLSVSVGGSERSVVSISSMFFVTVSFLPVSVFGLFNVFSCT